MATAYNSTAWHRDSLAASPLVAKPTDFKVNSVRHLRRFESEIHDFTLGLSRTHVNYSGTGTAEGDSVAIGDGLGAIESGQIIPGDVFLARLRDVRAPHEFPEAAAMLQEVLQTGKDQAA